MESITRGRQDANTVKLGYFRTDDETLRRLSRIIRPASPDGEYNHVIDPACGEGLALAALSRAWGNSKSYGIEYDAERFKASANRLDTVLHSDALSGVYLSSGWAGAMLFNPPYGDTLHDKKQTRLESRFWERHASRLVRGGLMVAILPRVLFLRAPGLVRAMSFFFAGNRVGIYACPTQQYRQVVIIGYRRADTSTGQDKALHERLVQIGTGEFTPPELPESLAEPFPFPPGHAPVNFDALHLTREMVELALARESDATLNRVEADLAAQTADRTRRPSVMPLRQGHIPILLAAGGLDGIVRDDQGAFLVKGSVKRVAIENTDNHETESESGSTRNVRTVTTRYVWQTRIMAWDITPGHDYALVEIQ